MKSLFFALLDSSQIERRRGEFEKFNSEKYEKSKKWKANVIKNWILYVRVFSRNEGFIL